MVNHNAVYKHFTIILIFKISITMRKKRVALWLDNGVGVLE